MSVGDFLREDGYSQRGLLNLLQYRIASHYPAIKQILDGEVPWPRFAIVYPVRGCNLRCPHCEYASENQGPIQLFDLDRAISVLTELRLRGLEAVEFCGGGEPTLHPRLAELTARLRAQGLYVGLITNGFAVREADISVFAQHMSYLRVSLDAATPLTFATVKRCPSTFFDKVLQTIKRLLEARTACASRIEIGLKFCITQHNLQEIEAAAQLANELGVDSIQYKPARNCTEEPSSVQLAEAAKAIDRVRSAEHRRCVVLGSTAKSTVDFRCLLTPLNVVIDTDGSVYLCCYFTHRKGKHCIGNVCHQNISDIWAGSGHRAAIEGIDPRECNVYDCRFHNYNKCVRDTMMEGNGFWSFL